LTIPHPSQVNTAPRGPIVLLPSPKTADERALMKHFLRHRREHGPGCPAQREIALILWGRVRRELAEEASA
jgi:hypothetical protein